MTVIEFIKEMVTADGFWYGIWTMLGVFGIHQLFTGVMSSISEHKKKKARQRAEMTGVPSRTGKAVILKPFEEDRSRKGA